MRYHFYGRSRDTYGNVITSVEVSIYIAGTTTPVSIYTSKTGGTAISTTPQVTTNSKGLFDIWVDDSDYPRSTLFDIVVGDTTYTEFDIFREVADVEDHGSLSGLLDDDHTQYMPISAYRAFTAPVSGQTPTLDNHLTTKTYVDTLVSASSGGVEDHGLLTGLHDDDHNQYMLVSGGRAFTVPISGQYPTLDNHLSTKTYVDTLVAATSGSGDHGLLTGLGDDDHTQYMPISASRSFTAPVSGQDPTLDNHLTTKTYVDTLVSATSGGVEDHGLLTGLGDDDHQIYSLSDGSRPYTGDITTQNVIPSADDTHTLGTSANRWAALHLASKIYYSTTLEFQSSGGSIRDMEKLSPVLYGTSETPPSSAGYPNGTLYFQYTA